MIFSKYRLSVYVFLFIILILSIVQLKTPHPMLIAERLWVGAGWIEIFVIAVYGAFVAFKMQTPQNVPRWRRITWTIFSVVFFAQLFLGLSGIETFLMTGKLHLPIPTMILSGPIYRLQLGFMTILFLTTIVLTGPAWCSQLCYFGAFDNIASRGKTQKGAFKYKLAIKSSLLLVVILVTIVLRWFNVPLLWATIIAITFGVIGILLMVFVSSKKGKMVHCVLYCPIGTIVNLLKFVNPFRMYIDSSCNMCMKCTNHCKYDALNPEDVRNKKPSITCTLCGDCLAACRDNSIKYKFFSLSPQNARTLYLFLTISLHACFLALGRI